MNTFDPSAIRPKDQQGPQVSFEKVMVWALAPVIVPAFAIASFLPLFSLFSEDRGWRTAIPDILFLGSGFVGLLGLYLLAKISVSQYNSEPVDGFVRGSALKLVGYATAWLVLYIVYRAIV